MAISHIFFPEKLDQCFLFRYNEAVTTHEWFAREVLTLDTIEKKFPQRDTKEEETEGVLQKKLGTKCPIEKPGVRRMTKPADRSLAACRIILGRAITHKHHW